MKYQIIPSVIAKNQKELDLRLQKVFSLSNVIQLDVMDGKLVKNRSFMFNFKLQKFKFNKSKKNKSKVYEAHLMMQNPLNWIKKHASKVNLIIIHAESNNLEQSIKLIQNKNKTLGIALNPKTSVNSLIPYLNQVNQVTILSVNPGKYGSKFIPKTLNKVKQLRKLKPKLNIEIDGGLGSKHIIQAKRAGANKFVSGSYLQTSKNIKSDFKILKKLIK